MRVLVLDAEVLKTLAVVRALGEEVDVWTASATRPALAAWSRHANRHLHCPSDDTFPTWLVNCVQTHAIDMLICTQERTIIRASTVYDTLKQAGVCLTFPPLSVLANAFDKAKTIRCAQHVGVPVPETIIPEDMGQVKVAAAQIGYPVVIKPRHSHFWDGTRFVDSPGLRYATTEKDLDAILQVYDVALPPPLVQAYIPGYGAGIFLLIDAQGNIAAEFAHQRLRDIRPTGSGSVLRKSVAVNPELRERSHVLLREMNWWGIAMVEYRIDERTGEAVLMEVNGRFWGSLQLAVDAGVNFPRLLLEVSQGKSPPVPTYREGDHVRWWFGDLVRTLRILKGQPATYPGSFPSRWTSIKDFLGPQPSGTRNEVLRLSDPWPVVGQVLSILRRIV